ncbi:hypothetical protein [Altererythrobacter sp. Z27]|uniref:hypothetical protein n=1 Tax=Altererythrobacter sp. Z27 TaxID=3461147 RepID=UPI0040451006
MEPAANLATASVERLVEQRGDITGEVIARYYARFPEARASFEHHGCGYREELEGRMVNTTAFFLFQWIENRASTLIEQGTTIPHHHDTLQVGPQWYMGLIDTVLEVLLETIPAENADEREMWITARGEIAQFVERMRGEFFRRDDDGPLPAFEPQQANPA